MGGRHSKHNAFTNDLSSEKPIAAEEKDTCCLFCPLPKTLPTNSLAASRSSSTHNLSRPNSHHDGFGTPLPDTPVAIRRKRAAMEENNYYDDEEEKKTSSGSSSSTYGGRIGGGSYNEGAGGDAIYSSRYDGLEKESTTMFLHETTTGANNNSSRGISSSMNNSSKDAEIYEGPNAESKLYQKYELCEVLGVGSTSTCHRCIELATGTSRACKIVDKQEIDPAMHNMLDQFYTEIKTLRSLQHPNIIQLYDVFITEDKIYIIMELMSGGELFDYVVQKGTLTEEEASRIVRKVTSALVYMHSKNVIHRDMKPENLLLAHIPRSSHDIEVKIIDFGLSKVLGNDGPVASTFLGTRGYLAPEMIQRRNYTKSVDAWALGVVIFVLLCGCLPFDDDCQSVPNSPDLRQKFTLRFPRWAKDLSPSAKDLLNHLLDIDSRRRYTADQAMEHPWVRGTTASKDSLLQSPGRIKPSPKHGTKSSSSSQATKDHVSQMVANRAIANAQLAGARSPKVHVRKTSI